jgi:hypothetical protein
MQLKNVSARAYGIMGKIYAPLQTFELTDAVAIASIQPAIDSGDMVVVDPKAEVEADKSEKAKPGRKPKAEVEAE